MLAAALPLHAQQAAAPAASPAPAASAPAPTTAPAANATSAATTSSAAAPAGPSPETLKKAKELGLHAETHKGVTQYCWEDSSIGSRFTTKKCVTEDQLDEIIEQREAAKDVMRRQVTISSSH